MMTSKKTHQSLTWGVELKTAKGKDHLQNRWHQLPPIFTFQASLEW